jgi:predicted ArsR family transcriptional regulator
MTTIDLLRSEFADSRSPMTVDALARRLGRSSSAVRRGLALLVESGEVECERTRVQRRFAAHRATREKVYRKAGNR